MNVKELTNTALVKLCAQEPRNRTAWSEFYARFDERIWLMVYRECQEKGLIETITGFQQLVQDLVQDVYVRLVEKNCKALRTFNGVSENSIFTYLGIIAKNVVRNYLTKMGAQKRPSIEKSIDEVVSTSEEDGEIFVKDILRSPYVDVEEALAQEILKEEIEDILNRFLKGKDKERNKMIFKLYFYEGVSPEEIVSRLDFALSPKSVGNIISRIKQLLRKELLEQKMEV